MEELTIILAAGGTGGHIFPAHSLGEELAKRNYNPILITDKRYNKFASKGNQLNVEFISAATPFCRGIKRLIAWITILMGVIKANFLLKKYKAKLVVGFGGYPAFPTLFASKLLKIPIIIHEQNSALGRANKYFSRSARHIATSFPNTAGIGQIDQSKISFTGNPVRKEIIEIGKLPYPEVKDKLNILVIGGSQGAAIFSKVIPDALCSLDPSIQSKINLVQQCKKEDLDVVESKYKQSNISVKLDYFFNDMHVKLKEAHIVIARGGASTITELKAAGRPAIIVPIPYSFENHQLHNARGFIEDKVGWIIPQENFTAQNLATKIEQFINNPNILEDAAKNFKKTEYSAVEQLAELVEYNLKKLNK